MDNQVDLDALDALHAAATPGKLRGIGQYLSHEGNTRIEYTVEHLDELGQETYFSYYGPYQAIPFARSEDAEWHAALHNAYPAIAAELRALRARVAELEARDGN